MNKPGYTKTAVTTVTPVTPLITLGFFCNRSVTEKKAAVTHYATTGQSVTAVTERNRCKLFRLYAAITSKYAGLPGYRIISIILVTAVTAVTEKKHITQKSGRICTSMMKGA